MKGKRVVITGGAGFIGSNLARALSTDNEVIIIDDMSSGRHENIENVEGARLAEGSVTDLDLLRGGFDGADHVFHLAALASVPASIDDPVRADAVNVGGTLNVLIAARDAVVKSVVFSSSAAVYGDLPGFPKREDSGLAPMSPYAVSKLVGEHYCRVFSEVYGLATVSLRYFNVYGPRQDPSSHYAAVIPHFISRALEGKPLVIFGDGEQTRDFVSVRDVVRANVLAAESAASFGKVINIAGGASVSVNDLASSVINACDVKGIEVEHAEPRAGDIKHSLADISLARDLLGFEPGHSLKDGLADTVEHFRNQCREP